MGRAAGLGDGDVIGELRLGRGVTGPRRARLWVAELIVTKTGLSDAQAADAVLMVDELLTNVLVHTSSEPTLVVRSRTNEVVFEVHDGDPKGPRPPGLEPPGHGGNGMRIVEGWSNRWGVLRFPHGKAVWFALTL